MSADATRHAQYLESLARLHRGWSHEARSHLGNVLIQIDLLLEILSRDFPASPAEIDRLRVPLERARKGAARLEGCLSRYLGAAMPRGEGLGPLELGAEIAELAELLEPAARERRITWSVAAPAAAVVASGDPNAIRESLAIAAIGVVTEAAAGSRIEVRIERSGDSAVVRFDGAAAPLELAFPTAPVAR